MRIDLFGLLVSLAPMTPTQLREIMARLRMNNADLARVTGVSVRTVEGWLQDRPPSSTAQRLIRALAAGTPKKMLQGVA